MPYRPMKHYPYGQGTRHLYLLHFSRPLAHARHYLGQTDRTVDERVAEHRAGRGANLTRWAVASGIELVLARVWVDAPRCEEQRLKNRGRLRRLCPVCIEQDKRIPRVRIRQGTTPTEKVVDPSSLGEALTDPRNAL
jgi:predicted GIY-YIG superfamily endonuclease